jgi:hypothetical protein
MEDRGPLTWELVCLLPMAAEFVLTNNTAGKASYGPYNTRTRDGLVHVERAGQHLKTVKQCCCRLPTLLKSCVGHCQPG